MPLQSTKSRPTAERVRELFICDPDTGVLIRIVGGRGRRAGTVAGNPNVDGYLQITVDGAAVYAHQIVWLHVTGHWPVGQIDHKDGVKHHNQFSNLRDVDQFKNMQNMRKAPASSSSGVLGASPTEGRYRACIRVDGRFKHIGRYATAEEAHAAYISAKRLYHAGNTL